MANREQTDRLVEGGVEMLPDLRYAFLPCADLSDASLFGARLNHLDLCQGDLSGADLDHTHLLLL